MKEFDLQIKETVVFNYTIMVEAENADKLDEILDKVEEKGNLFVDSIDDYVYSLKQNGIKVTNVVEYGSGESTLECLDVEGK